VTGVRFHFLNFVNIEIRQQITIPQVMPAKATLMSPEQRRARFDYARNNESGTTLGADLETILWTLDLLAVTYLCFWARKRDLQEKNQRKAGR
jgi:cbb3-type cytochrome oxidase subunit 3